MRKAFLRKIISAFIATATMITLLPIGVSAEWHQNFDKTWSYSYDSSKIKGWKSISGTWYYFNSNGMIETGWINDSGNWYYLNNSGAMQTGWVTDKGKWYHLNYSGRMETGWVYDKENWYYLNNSGDMQTGWIRDNGKWYYSDNNGVMKTGVVNISDKTYYFNKSGELQQSRDYLQQTSEKNNVDITDSDTVDVNGLPKLPNNYSISVQAYAENKILELMNQKRTEAGLKPLILDNALVRIARYKSNHMIQYNYFDHTTPEGGNWTNWLDIIGYSYTLTGENIAYNNYDPVELFNQWWNSPGHKANMMKSTYNKVGIGVINGDGKCMGTQTFSN